jgi:hypothetical protein
MMDVDRLFGFPLGEPSREDVDAAAALLVRYRREAPLSDDHAAMFLQMVDDPAAVTARANELEAAAAGTA